jgi:phenylpropionate dioxygenase-like ring-hydroxylating dioxygenase large terminal subunit
MTNLDRIKERVSQGLHGQWYVVAKSVQVRGGKPLAVRALGKKLVLWRNAQGAICCLEDFCPHRGAPLSRGEVFEGHVVCRYHGVTLDGTGKIVRVPAMPACPMEGRLAGISYAVHEANDGVFVYFPSLEKPEAPPLDLPPEFSSPEWSSFLCSSIWNCNHQYIADNTADPMHGCYLHADSFTLAYGAKQDLVRLDKAESGFIVTRVGQAGENFDWTHVVTDTSAPYIRLDIPYPTAGGPGGPFRILGFMTPVDQTKTRIFFWRNRKVSEIAREAWRFMFRAYYEKQHWDVLEQDRNMLENIPYDARQRELLYQHDMGVVRLRRILAERAKRQLEVEDASQRQKVS